MAHWQVSFQHEACDTFTCTERKWNAIYGKYTSAHHCSFIQLKNYFLSSQLFGINKLQLIERKIWAKKILNRWYLVPLNVSMEKKNSNPFTGIVNCNLNFISNAMFVLPTVAHVKWCVRPSEYWHCCKPYRAQNSLNQSHFFFSNIPFEHHNHVVVDDLNKNASIKFVNKNVYSVN